MTRSVTTSAEVDERPLPPPDVSEHENTHPAPAPEPELPIRPADNDDVVTFTASEWRHDQVSEAFGVRKTVAKLKEPTPGVKPVLIFHDSYLIAKKRMRQLKQFHPIVDLPEVISAMIDVCDADLDLMPRVTLAIVERRERQLASLRVAAIAAQPRSDATSPAARHPNDHAPETDDAEHHDGE